MTFLHYINYKKCSILLETAFEIPVFLMKEVREHTAAIDYYKYGLLISRMINKWNVQKKNAVATFVTSSLVSFF